MLFLAGDLIDQPEQRRFDELDQPLEHLRLAGKVPVKRRFRDRKLGGQRRRGDALALGLLQHLGQRLQDLQTALAGLGTLAHAAADIDLLTRRIRRRLRGRGVLRRGSARVRTCRHTRPLPFRRGSSHVRCRGKRGSPAHGGTGGFRELGVDGIGHARTDGAEGHGPGAFERSASQNDGGRGSGGRQAEGARGRLPL